MSDNNEQSHSGEEKDEIMDTVRIFTLSLEDQNSDDQTETTGTSPETSSRAPLDEEECLPPLPRPRTTTPLEFSRLLSSVNDFFANDITYQVFYGDPVFHEIFIIQPDFGELPRRRQEEVLNNYVFTLYRQTFLEIDVGIVEQNLNVMTIDEDQNQDRDRDSSDMDSS